MNRSIQRFRLYFRWNHAFLTSGLVLTTVLAVLGFASSAYAQTPPTVNGLFYGDGDNTRYAEYASSEEGSKLYTYFDAANKRLYVAAVISHSVNDMVCAENQESGAGGIGKNQYVLSAGWTQGAGRNCKKPGDSEYLGFTFSCGGSSYVWNQGQACPANTTAPQSGWVSDESCSTSTGTWPPSADIESSSSYVNNMNAYQAEYPLPHSSAVPWELYTPSTDYAEWRSPSIASAPYDVTQVPGYPTFTTYEQLLTGEPSDKGWEWSMVYEWSLDVSDCTDSAISFSPSVAHHSPPKSGDQNEEWPDAPTDPLSDWGDLPDTYGTTATNNGPRHTLTADGAYLGSELDPEPNGQPDANADGDNNSAADDEEGVVFLQKFVSGSTADIQVTVTDNDGTAYLSAWIDFDGDGVLDQLTLADGFNTPVSDLELTSGVHTLTVNVPNVALATSLAARFRLTDETNQGGILSTGAAENGEVEDYIIDNTTLSITISYFLAERDGDTVNFVWQTATETGVAGFNLFAETNGDLVQLNDELIPSPVIDSVTPTDYSYEAVTSATTFYIEEVSIAGSTDRLGPFTLGMPAGAHVDVDVAPIPFIWLPMISN